MGHGVDIGSPYSVKACLAAKSLVDGGEPGSGSIYPGDDDD